MDHDTMVFILGFVVGLAFGTLWDQYHAEQHSVVIPALETPPGLSRDNPTPDKQEH